MRQSFRVVTILLFSLSLVNISKGQVNTVYDELVYVNKEWKNQADIDPSLKSKPAFSLSEKELVRMHLREVEALLRKRSTEHLSTLQKKNRENNLNVLHSYWQNGVFPINTRHYGRQPYFIDEKGTYCAVGYLMKESGADDVAMDINKTQNYNYLADIDHPKLMNWVNNSGLDFGELALIQPGYGIQGLDPTVTEMHYNNAGADVNEYLEVLVQAYIVIGPTFPVLDSIFLYNSSGVIYKKLAISNLTLFNNPLWFGGSFDARFGYYIFPNGEDFADSGKIELRGVLNYPIASSYGTISTVVYNSTGVIYTQSAYLATPIVHTSVIHEDENSQAGYSLNFCNLDDNATWSANILPETIGVANPCISWELIPITLSSFDYTINNKNIVLNWTTSQEINSDHFEVERSSDGIHFVSLGNVRAAGNSNSTRHYSFVDTHPNYLNHYRLKSVDVDGKFNYSRLLYVKMMAANPLVIGQNLVTSNLEVQVNTDQANAGDIIIYDFSGREVIHLKAKSGAQNINVSALGAEKYIIRLRTNDGQVYTGQFVKQ
jgi:hypothetical protein